MNRNYEDNAVSPVIATILLVAIVMVLAAVVAVVALGMAGGQNDLKDVGLTVTSDHTDVMVTLFTGQDVSDLQSLRVSVAGNPYMTESQSTNTTDCVRQIGVPIRFTGVGVEGTHTTTVTGVFSDTTAVMLWTGQLAFAPWPVDASYHSFADDMSGQAQKAIKVTLPRDWNAGNINSSVSLGENFIGENDNYYLWEWEKQLVVSVYNSNGNLEKKQTYTALYLSIAMNHGGNVVIPVGSGAYHVEVRGQTVDCTTGEVVIKSDSLLYDGTVVVP